MGEDLTTAELFLQSLAQNAEGKQSAELLEQFNKLPATIHAFGDEFTPQGPTLG